MKNFWLAPFLTLFDLNFYRETAKAKPRWGFYYLAYWAGIAAFLGMLTYAILIMPQMNKFFDWFEKTLPPLAYNAEVGLITSQASPYEMKSPEYGKLVTFDMEADRPTQEQISYSPFFVTAQITCCRGSKKIRRIWIIL